MCPQRQHAAGPQRGRPTVAGARRQLGAVVPCCGRPPPPCRARSTTKALSVGSAVSVRSSWRTAAAVSTDRRTRPDLGERRVEREVSGARGAAPAQERIELRSRAGRSSRRAIIWSMRTIGSRRPTDRLRGRRAETVDGEAQRPLQEVATARPRSCAGPDVALQHRRPTRLTSCASRIVADSEGGAHEERGAGVLDSGQIRHRATSAPTRHWPAGSGPRPLRDRAAPRCP